MKNSRTLFILLIFCFGVLFSACAPKYAEFTNINQRVLSEKGFTNFTVGYHLETERGLVFGKVLPKDVKKLIVAVTIVNPERFPYKILMKGGQKVLFSSNKIEGSVTLTFPLGSYDSGEKIEKWLLVKSGGIDIVTLPIKTKKPYSYDEEEI